MSLDSTPCPQFSKGDTKEEFIKTLQTETGRRAFLNSFERILAGYHRGGIPTFLLKEEAGDMRKTADEIRDSMPEGAKIIDEARQKLEAFIERIDTENQTQT